MESNGRKSGKDKRRERPVETLTTGLTFIAIFGALTLFVPGAHWLIFPLIFVGVLPAIRGLTGLIARRAERIEAPPPPSPATSRASDEKELLLVARASGGVVTPALAALKTSLSIDAAEKILQDMASRGHVTMIVGEDGRVEYHFPEFGARLGGAGGGTALLP
jgi:hypothetical protein